MRDKARIIRVVKASEIGIMLVGGLGLLLAWQGLLNQTFTIGLMLLALLAMGVHSTFFGPIKYAILPQHLHEDEVLAGTGLVEAGTYIAILAGTILAGWIPVEWAAAGVVLQEWRYRFRPLPTPCRQALHLHAGVGAGSRT